MSLLDQVAFIEGHWRGTFHGAVSEEIWLPPSGGAMLGAYRWIENGKVKFFELITIAEDEHGLVYRFRHFDPDLTPWEERDRPFALPLVAAANDEAAFEGPNPRGEVVRFTFSRRGDDGLLVVVERAGERHEFAYERVR